MATIKGRQVRDVAKERLANLKATGGLPPKGPKGSALGNDAKNIKIHQNYKKLLKDE